MPRSKQLRPKPRRAPQKNTRKHEIIYLACPYTHPDRRVREERFRVATRAAAQLIEEGLIVYSPITMTHPIDVLLAADKQTLGSEYWVAFDEAFMEICSEMVVLTVKGWGDSSGVNTEIGYFHNRGKPVRYMSPAAADRRFLSPSAKDEKV